MINDVSGNKSKETIFLVGKYVNCRRNTAKDCK